MKKIVLAVLAILILAGCGSPEPKLHKYHIVTADGRELEVEYHLCTWSLARARSFLVVDCTTDGSSWDRVYIATEFWEVK